MAPPLAPPPQRPPPTRKRTRKRKRRAASSSSSSGADSDSDSSDIAAARAPVPAAASSSSDTDSSSSSEDESLPPRRTQQRTQQSPPPPPASRRSPTPEPHPVAPFPGNAQDEQILRQRFRKFWMASVADAFSEDLGEIRKEANLSTPRLALLIDSLAAGADVFAPSHGAGDASINEMDVAMSEQST
ncbi:uncharacterized protein C8Q71DRAFT_728655 [Rhodofomes roseus]|uniref:Ribosome assembly protein 3 n=1 Tax=Rhodofomes roseus TaxID=34475 RepID=A0ABQ8KWP9_9APHY|nr:uncharacterized protein C8Q71DRAFT_728655 [Rhodofomes roseus]KAH9843489.1 hypothetical protein C8Q71DRAFT_728655 [Rhodofomes roseus]